jgi:transcription termination factor Rho
MDPEEFPKSDAADSKPARKTTRTAKKAARKTPARRRKTKDESSEAAVDAAPVEKKTRAKKEAATDVEMKPTPVAAPSLKASRPQQEEIPLSFSADPNEEPPAPKPVPEEKVEKPEKTISHDRSNTDHGDRRPRGDRERGSFNNDRSGSGDRRGGDFERGKPNRPDQDRDRERGGNAGSSGGGGNPRGKPQGGGKGGNFDRKERFSGGQPNQQKQGGGPGGNNNQNPNNRKNKKKKGRRDQPESRKKRNRAAGDFFGAQDTFVVEVGDLPSLDLLNSFEAMTEAAEAARGGEGGPVDFVALCKIPLNELVDLAREEFEIELQVAPVREQVINEILAKAWLLKRPIEIEGILETTQDGYGLIVYEHDSYRVKPLNCFVPAALIKRYGIKRGTILRVQAHPKRQPLPENALEQIRATQNAVEGADPVDAIPSDVEDEIAEEALAALFPPNDFVQDVDADDETTPYTLRVISIMGKDPELNLRVTPFEDLVPYYPTERLLLETEPGVPWDNIAMRVVDLLTPVGLGQRGLIVAPPRTGKTILQQGIANAVVRNTPKAHLIVLLIDERPEEVTDFRRQVKRGEVIASTFDESPENHVHCAEMVIEKARRMVEDGRDVIILLDSITRLARAYNALAANSGKILSGGVEATALQKPKRFFGSARNIEDGGSLTIIGTALVETGSRMDEVIFEEFKGTGNMELHLDRQLSDKRIFPAIEMAKSGTRKEELVYHKDEMQKVYSLRRAMKGVPPIDAMEMLITRIKKTPTNVQFLMGLNS